MKLFVLIIISCCCILSSDGRKNRTKIRKSKPDLIKDLKCVDRNLQRSIEWKPNNVTDNLTLIEYRVQYCIIISCDKGFKKADCYADEARTNKIQHLKTNSCIVLDSEIWSQRVYRVRGVYRSPNGTVKSKYTEEFCVPLDEDTFLSAPDINVTEKTTSLDIFLTLDSYLEETLQKFSELSIIFEFCVHKKGSICSDTTMEYKTSNDPRQPYNDLEAGTKYEVQGWYTVTGDRSVKSQVATTYVSTLPDPFPIWAKLFVILLVLVLVMLGIGIKMTIWAPIIEMKKLEDKPIPIYAQDANRQLEIYEDDSDDSVWNTWMKTQNLTFEDEFIPPVKNISVDHKETIQETNSVKNESLNESNREHDELARQGCVIRIKPPATNNIQNPFLEMSTQNELNNNRAMNWINVVPVFKGPPVDCNIEMTSYVREQLPSQSTDDGFYYQKT